MLIRTFIQSCVLSRFIDSNWDKNKHSRNSLLKLACMALQIKIFTACLGEGLIHEWKSCSPYKNALQEHLGYFKHILFISAAHLSNLNQNVVMKLISFHQVKNRHFWWGFDVGFLSFTWPSLVACLCMVEMPEM